jgi:hypothetical protein
MLKKGGLILTALAARTCEHTAEPSGSIQCWEILEQLSNWQLLEKDRVPWS